MAWTGKAIGAGLGAMVLGPIGAAIGGVAGHWFDQNQDAELPEAVRLRLAILAVLTAAASANHEIHPKERKRLHNIAAAAFPDWSPDMLDDSLAKIAQASPTLEECADVVRQLPDDDRQVLIACILSVLYADGQMDGRELDWLQELVQVSGTNPALWEQTWWFFERPDSRPQRTEALRLLGLTGESAEADIKAAYRRACMEYHPDRLGSVAEPIRRLAEEKLQQLNAAYEFLQTGADGLQLVVMTASREIKPMQEVAEREVVLCPLCETRNRLPDRAHHASCRCGDCSAYLAVPQPPINHN